MPGFFDVKGEPTKPSATLKTALGSFEAVIMASNPSLPRPLVSVIGRVRVDGLHFTVRPEVDWNMRSGPSVLNIQISRTPGHQLGVPPITRETINALVRGEVRDWLRGFCTKENAAWCSYVLMYRHVREVEEQLARKRKECERRLAAWQKLTGDSPVDSTP